MWKARRYRGTGKSLRKKGAASCAPTKERNGRVVSPRRGGAQCIVPLQRKRQKPGMLVGVVAAEEADDDSGGDPIVILMKIGAESGPIVVGIE